MYGPLRGLIEMQVNALVLLTVLPSLVFHPSQIASMIAIVAPSGSHILISLNRSSACAKSMRQSASSRSLELNKLHMRMSMLLVYVSQKTSTHFTVPGSSYRICLSFDHDKVFGSGMRWSFTTMRAPGFKAGTVALSILITWPSDQSWNTMRNR